MGSDHHSATSGDPGDSIGRALHRLRRNRGISGHALAGMATISQSKISRIETGLVVPSPDDVEALLRALGENDQVVQDFREWAARIPRDADDEPATKVLIGRFQRTYAEYERDARSVRLFQPTVVPGLLQTSEYARSLITRSCDVMGIDFEAEGQAAIADRASRQKVIYDGRKDFSFVVLESVLAYQVGSPAVMIAQLDFLADLAQRDNVSLKVVPEGTDLLVPPAGSVEIFDEKQALFETLLGIQPSTQPEDVQLVIKVFEYLETAAVGDLDKILQRHRRRYLDQLT